MPEDATAKAILRLLLTFVKSKFIGKGFPVPAGAFKKKNFPVSDLMLCIIQL